MRSTPIPSATVQQRSTPLPRLAFEHFMCRWESVCTYTMPTPLRARAARTWKWKWNYIRFVAADKFFAAACCRLAGAIYVRLARKLVSWSYVSCCLSDFMSPVLEASQHILTYYNYMFVYMLATIPSECCCTCCSDSTSCTGHSQEPICWIPDVNAICLLCRPRAHPHSHLSKLLLLCLIFLVHTHAKYSCCHNARAFLGISSFFASSFWLWRVFLFTPSSSYLP